jgi:hypothetical protein
MELSDLPADVLTHITNGLTYEMIRIFSMTSRTNRERVRADMLHIIATFNHLFPDVVMEEHELIERIFYLNDDIKRPNMISAITIVNDTWTKGRNSIAGESWSRGGESHRVDGPAETTRNVEGHMIEQYWCVDGKLHNENGPTHIEWYDSGQMQKELWGIRGQVHREGGPAHTEWNAAGIKIFEHWYSHGKLHRIDGPAVNNWAHFFWDIVPREESWYMNGVRHRGGDNPARTIWTAQGRSEEWFVNGERYRPNGPLLVLYS